MVRRENVVPAVEIAVLFWVFLYTGCVGGRGMVGSQTRPSTMGISEAKWIEFWARIAGADTKAIENPSADVRNFVARNALVKDLRPEDEGAVRKVALEAVRQIPSGTRKLKRSRTLGIKAYYLDRDLVQAVSVPPSIVIPLSGGRVVLAYLSTGVSFAVPNEFLVLCLQGDRLIRWECIEIPAGTAFCGEGRQMDGRMLVELLGWNRAVTLRTFFNTARFTVPKAD